MRWRTLAQKKLATDATNSGVTLRRGENGALQRRAVVHHGEPGCKTKHNLIEQDVPSLEPLAHHFEIILQLLHASLWVLRAERPRHTCNDITTGWMGRRDSE